METMNNKWDLIKDIIRTECSLSDVSFNTWIKPLELYSVIDETVTILIPSDQSHAREYISQKFKNFFQVAITEMFEIPYAICFMLENEIEKKVETNTEIQQNVNHKTSNLNDKYKFDTFVVGNNNNFAHSVCVAVAESQPGEAFNPLFIYGDPGLGKTHLMHSIGHYMLEQDSSKNVLYVTSEEFTNEVIDCLTKNRNHTSMSKFREKYRSVDMLMVDDVQFLIGKESTQEEFFNTFNTLYESGKQIVLTSDRPPKDMKTLNERISSRFQSGLIADIQAPDYETRVAILIKYAENFDKKIDEEIIIYIANNIKSNVRVLEGALNKIIATSRLSSTELTLSLAENVLKDMININETSITPQLIIDVVAEQFGISPQDITAKKRSKEFVFPRHIIMYLCREMLDIPLEQVAKIVDRKDHSTVLNGIKNINNELENDEDLRNKLDMIRKKINPNE